MQVKDSTALVSGGASGLFDTSLFSNLPEDALEMLARNMIFPRRAGSGDELARLAERVIENDYINAITIQIHAGARARPSACLSAR